MENQDVRANGLELVSAPIVPPSSGEEQGLDFGSNAAAVAFFAFVAIVDSLGKVREFYNHFTGDVLIDAFWKDVSTAAKRIEQQGKAMMWAEITQAIFTGIAAGISLYMSFKTIPQAMAPLNKDAGAAEGEVQELQKALDAIENPASLRASNLGMGEGLGQPGEEIELRERDAAPAPAPAPAADAAPAERLQPPLTEQQEADVNRLRNCLRQGRAKEFNEFDQVRQADGTITTDPQKTEIKISASEGMDDDECQTAHENLVKNREAKLQKWQAKTQEMNSKTVGFQMLNSGLTSIAQTFGSTGHGILQSQAQNCQAASTRWSGKQQTTNMILSDSVQKQNSAFDNANQAWQAWINANGACVARG